MEQVVRPDQYATVRQINEQINHMESRNNLPIVNSRPLRLGLDISNVCNVRCIFCLADSGRKRPSDPDAFRKPEWLDPFEPLLPFLTQAILSSYEAVLNPWLDQFIDKLWKHQTPLQIFSNGKAFVPELSEYLLQHGLKSLWCSFHGAQRNTYESIMKGSNYDQVISNLMHMKIFARKNKLAHYKLTMVFCAMRRTIEELCDYVDLAHRVGAKEIQVNYLLVTRQGTGLEHEAMCFHPELYDRMVLAAKHKAAKLGIHLKHQRLFREGAKEADTGPCYRPWEHLTIRQDGNATVCCGGCGSVGNMFEQGFPQLWNSPRMTSFRARVNSGNPPLSCRNCTRGRENPWDITSHCTYLRNMPEEERTEHIHNLLQEMNGELSPEAKNNLLHAQHLEAVSCEAL